MRQRSAQTLSQKETNCSRRPRKSRGGSQTAAAESCAPTAIPRAVRNRDHPPCWAGEVGARRERPNNDGLEPGSARSSLALPHERITPVGRYRMNDEQRVLVDSSHAMAARTSREVAASSQLIGDARRLVEASRSAVAHTRSTLDESAAMIAKAKHAYGL